jgi:tetratricopeptide (TPR) repeat protein
MTYSADVDQDASFLLDKEKHLSQSVLWQYQRQFFVTWGVDAWSKGTVPHYITSNPFIARAYARVVMGWLRDCQSASDSPDFPSLDRNHPVYLIELGAGSGRFAFHFLKRFLETWRVSSLRDVPFKYVMTDFAERNLACWREHPRLRPLVEAGVLDFALFDSAAPQEMHLQELGTILAPGTVKNPLAVVANYVFDSIPADAFAIRGGRLHESLVTISASDPEPAPADPELFNLLRPSYEHRPTGADYYDDADWNAVLHGYTERLNDTVVLFPVAALNCLRFLRQLAGDRLLLLCGDKGPACEEDLRGAGDPVLTVHGSFSLRVNYPALAEVSRRQGGQVLQTPHHHAHLAVAAFLFGRPPGDWLETRLAFDEAVVQGGPDELYSLKKGVERFYDRLEAKQLLAYLRLSGYDANILLGCSASLRTLLGAADESLKREAQFVLWQVWDTYFPIGEAKDLPFCLGELLAAADYPVDALAYFQHSLQLHGPTANTFYKMAVCRRRLRQFAAAAEHARQALELNPDHWRAERLLREIEAEADQQGNCLGDCSRH